MMRQQFYTVANHSFSLEMAESSPLWRQLQNYGPFLGIPGDRVVFRLKAVPEKISTEGSERIYHASDPVPGDLVLNVFRNGKVYLIEFSTHLANEPTGLLRVDLERAEARLALVEEPRLQALYLNNALMTCYMLFTLDKKTLLTHASAVMTSQGRAFLFLGKSGTGKSTHSRLWMEHIEGTTLLNDDNPVVRLTDKGIAKAYGPLGAGRHPATGTRRPH